MLAVVLYSRKMLLFIPSFLLSLIFHKAPPIWKLILIIFYEGNRISKNVWIKRNFESNKMRKIHYTSLKTAHLKLHKTLYNTGLQGLSQEEPCLPFRRDLELQREKNLASPFLALFFFLNPLILSSPFLGKSSSELNKKDPTL